MLHKPLIKRYVCELCDPFETCANRTNLRIHLERRHKIILPEEAKVSITSERSKCKLNFIYVVIIKSYQDTNVFVPFRSISNEPLLRRARRLWTG